MDQQGFTARTEQRLMGYALKTLHDFSLIGDDTDIDGNLDPTTVTIDADAAGHLQLLGRVHHAADHQVGRRAVR